MPLMKCENLILTWSSTFTITNATGERKFAITDKKSYVTIVTLSNQDSAKLLQILKLDFKRTISWNKFQSKVPTERQNQYLDYLIDSSFQGVNRLYLLPIEDNSHRTRKQDIEKLQFLKGWLHNCLFTRLSLF